MRYRKRIKRSYRRDCRKRYNKKTRQCKTRPRSRRRNRRRGTMRGGYTLPKGITIPNKLPYTINQSADAEFSRNIYSPRLPSVKHIPVRQSQDFFGQIGPVPDKTMVEYSKKMNGGNKQSKQNFWRYFDNKFPAQIRSGEKNAILHSQKMKNNKVDIYL